MIQGRQLWQPLHSLQCRSGYQFCSVCGLIQLYALSGCNSIVWAAAAWKAGGQSTTKSKRQAVEQGPAQQRPGRRRPYRQHSLRAAAPAPPPPPAAPQQTPRPCPAASTSPTCTIAGFVTVANSTLCLFAKLLVRVISSSSASPESLMHYWHSCLNVTPGLRIWLVFAIGRQLHRQYMQADVTVTTPGADTPCCGTGPPRSGPTAALVWPRIGHCYLALDSFRHRAQHGTLQGCRVAGALQLHVLQFCPQIGLSSSSGAHAPPSGTAPGFSTAARLSTGLRTTALRHVRLHLGCGCNRGIHREHTAQLPSPRHLKRCAGA
jgi:hypothetical protein